MVRQISMFDEEELTGVEDGVPDVVKEEGLVFGVVVNKEDYDKSAICFMDRQALARGEREGIVVGLEE